MTTKDTYKNQGNRKRLVEELVEKGIKNEDVLRVIGAIPRHIFMDSALENFGYKDTAFPIGYNQTISQPFTVARQTELLEVNPGTRVLEIGTGSGYQAWVLEQLGCEVTSIERVEGLYIKSQKFFKEWNVKVDGILGDGFKGCPEKAPFDRIIVTCGAPEVPESLLAQLKIGGLMVIPVGEGEVQEMKRIVRVDEKNFKLSTFGQFSFVPMLKNVER